MLDKIQSKTPLICVAPNGAFKQKSDHGAIPLSIGEIAETAVSCYQHGARMLHFHLRDDHGKHLLNAKQYQIALDTIHTQLSQHNFDDMLLQVTTESANIYHAAAQMQCMYELKPAAYSLSIRELFSDKSLHKQAFDFIEWSFQQNINVQFIVYNTDDLSFYLNALDKQYIANDNNCKQSLLFVLGRYTDNAQSKPSDLISLLHSFHLHNISKTSSWMCCAFGSHEFQCLQAALLLGGDVRVGFENSLYNKQQMLAKDNTELVKQANEFITTNRITKASR